MSFKQDVYLVLSLNGNKQAQSILTTYCLEYDQQNKMIYYEENIT